MDNTSFIILAAGLGTRMKSKLPKVAVSTVYKPMISHVLDNVGEICPERTVVITGYRREIVEEIARGWKAEENNSNSNGDKKPCNIGKLSFAVQEQQLGTGHAALCAKDELSDFSGTVVIMNGDGPLITGDTLKKFLDHHNEQQSNVSVLSAHVDNAGSLGRIIRDKSTGEFLKIVEAKDCSPEELKINEINSGLYAVNSEFLWPALEKITPNNAQKELYLPDIVADSVNEGKTTIAVAVEDPNEVLGVNSRLELNIVNKILRQRTNDKLLLSGVSLEHPESFFADPTVKIASDVIIGQNVTLKGNTVIEEGVIIEGTAWLKDTTVKKGAHLKIGVRCENATIGEESKVGPFAQLRPGAILGKGVKIGNFVEVKNSEISDNVSAGHLTYLGDCSIGESTNIGAGTITVNYDGVNKHRTNIGANTSVGSNNSLVAPVTLGENSYTGAGSVIRDNVPPKSLSLTVGKLVVKENYADRKKTKK